MKKCALFVLAVIGAMIFQACRHCEKDRHYNERDITKHYIPHYNNGNYFVYQNALAPADVDTFYVRNYSDSMVFNYTEIKCDGDHYQTIKFALVSSRYNDTIICYIQAGPNADQYYLSGRYKGLTVASGFSAEDAVISWS